ncbi:MarR family transcriptional regulator [Streptomyces sp. SID3212]|uniref:MarR family winged helix-turn-helix transcriptional regulator n=1 Tax=unclassified Streptomyces TaxID=2593676 RepID=UPI001928E5A3|nr:MarR family transcriptional regulator [Streptomyces sp. SID3212]
MVGKGNPRPSATPAEALARMDRVMALSSVGQHRVAEGLGINITDLTCLGHILGAGDKPIGAGELAALANLTTGGVTGVLNRLERAGYAHREPDPADRRRIRVVAAPSTAARLHEVYGCLYERLNGLFADYAPEEIAVLVDWFTRAEDLMRVSLDEMPARLEAAEPAPDRS